MGADERQSEAGGHAAILPLGDRAVLVKFADHLSDAANMRAIDFAARLDGDLPDGVEEVAPGLVSVLLRTKPGVDFWHLSGQLRLRLAETGEPPVAAVHQIALHFDGEDIAEVADRLSLTLDQFIARHNATPLHMLATGFAPGFVYCGFHPEELALPRREQVRPMVPAGTVIFAARQTAIAATPIRTGWNVIGRTAFQNFDAGREPPTLLNAGDRLRFTEAG